MTRRRLTARYGRYGASKVPILAVLDESPGWISGRELLLRSGVKYYSLTTLLARWSEWGYVDRRYNGSYGSGTYEYRLASRGRGWLRAAERDLAGHESFMAELRAWQHYIQPQLDTLLDGPWADAIRARYEWEPG
jgi:hypothetical protein